MKNTKKIICGVLLALPALAMADSSDKNDSMAPTKVSNLLTPTSEGQIDDLKDELEEFRKQLNIIIAGIEELKESTCSGEEAAKCEKTILNSMYGGRYDLPEAIEGTTITKLNNEYGSVACQGPGLKGVLSNIFQCTKAGWQQISQFCS